MKKIIFLLALLVSSVANAQECFYPAHNYVGYSADLTNATNWTKPSTITNDTLSTTPPEVYGISQTFKGVGVAGQSLFLYGSTNNKYVTDNAGYILSAYVKYGTFQWMRFGVTGSATYGCNYDVQNGAVGSCVGLSNPTITPVGNGWYYITAYYAGASTAINNSFRLFIAYTTSSAGANTAMSGGETIYFTGFQAQDDRVTSPENKKYVETTDFTAKWSTPKVCTAGIDPFKTTSN